MTKTVYIRKAQDYEKSLSESINKILNDLGGIERFVKKGDRVALVGFGSFSVAKRAARKGRNPQTGKEIKIAAKKVVKFKAGAELAEKVK